MVNMRFVHGILFLASLHGIQSLKICSFNVRTFGKAKAAKEGILDVLVKIISRCDLLLMMEIKDSRNQAFPTLMKRLNNQNNRNEYESIISERLGRLAYKEQYAFIYRPQMNYFQVFMNATLKLAPKNVNVHVPLGSMPSIFPLLNKDTAEIGNSIPKLLSVKRSYQYPDHQADVFAREPFVVWFSSRSAMVKDFVIIPQHTRPGSSVSEINALYDVYMEMKRRWRAKYFILMGDFNADCDYVRKKEWINIRLRNDTNFVWLIGDNNDTTVKESTHCAYDRIVLRGEKLIKAVIPNSVNIFNFKEAYGMTEAQALNVSDHFPVEVELQESHGFSYWLRSFRGWKG